MTGLTQPWLYSHFQSFGIIGQLMIFTRLFLSIIYSETLLKVHFWFVFLAECAIVADIKLLLSI